MFEVMDVMHTFMSGGIIMGWVVQAWCWLGSWSVYWYLYLSAMGLMLWYISVLDSDHVDASAFVEFVAELFLGSFFVVDGSRVDGHLGVCPRRAAF